MCLQAVLVGQDESWRGEDCHDSTSALPADRWPTRICGGGPVPGFRGESERDYCHAWLLLNMMEEGVEKLKNIAL